jgi:endoglucanase
MLKSCILKYNMQVMKAGFLLAVFILVQFLVTAQLPRVSVKENQFVADGKPIIFHGMSSSDPEKLSRDQHWNKEYFEVMRSWGANLVRFPVHPAAWRKLGKDKYIALLDEGIKYASDAGMYVIIDWHSIGNLKTEKYQNEMYNTTRKETMEFWDIMSEKYKDNTTVAFFELFNEPTTYGGKLGDCTWAEWKQINEEMIKVIRDNGAQTVPLVAGFNWAYDLTPVADDPVNAEGVGYVSHPYPMKRPKPWEEKWTADWGFVAKKYPLILTEIGFCGEGERGAHIPVISDESYGDAITKYTKENNISYVVWVFDPQWAPMLIENWQFTPTRQGRYFKNALAF